MINSALLVIGMFCLVCAGQFLRIGSATFQTLKIPPALVTNSDGSPGIVTLVFVVIGAICVVKCTFRITES